MPKLGTYGSVRGALSNGCLYRDCVSKSEGLDAAEAAKCTVRRGDWVRRMRFWREITRGARAWVCAFLGTRAFPSKARSPDPATLPYGAGNCRGAGNHHCEPPVSGPMLHGP